MRQSDEDYEQEIIEWKKLFEDAGFERPRIVGGPDRGWWPLIKSLLGDLKAMGFSKDNLQITQVKEKFGGLRFYTFGNGVTVSTDMATAMFNRIYDAEKQSGVTCEQCGEIGALREGRWLKTLCDTHAEGRAVTSLE